VVWKVEVLAALNLGKKKKTLRLLGSLRLFFF
jgi:hypothetical protein